MLRKLRIIAAALCFTLITLLFLDVTGTLHTWFGWLAKIQFLPAVLALNVVVVVVLVALTLLLGRIYCSVICPLGVMQDVIAWLGKKNKKNRYSYSPAKTALRYGVLATFVAAMLAGFSSIAILIAPYSAFGRIAQNLFAPIYGWGNNLLAYIAERADSYAFYSTEVMIGSIGTFAVAAVTFVVIAILAWRGGRTFCNTICPVGSILGSLARFSLLKPVIDTDKCINCNLCSKNCKAACIDIPNHAIDYSRCVTCMDCIEKCPKNAISYTRPASVKKVEEKPAEANTARRNFIVGAGLVAAEAVRAQEMRGDGGYAVIIDKQAPDRERPITPPGSRSFRLFTQHCTGCQLCVANCPSQILRPSSDLKTFMQPLISYENGYCRPECNNCSQVCPAGAIKPISVEEKSSIQVGHAVWVKKNCIVVSDDVDCGNCARHCPSGAITMVPLDATDEKSRKIPTVNKHLCIGCGQCEYLCPSRPFSAIYVKGYDQHINI